MRPTVSIIIPVFNGINFFEEALKSVVQQSYDNIEIVVVNDGCIIDKAYGSSCIYDGYCIDNHQENSKLHIMYQLITEPTRISQ